MKGNSIRRYVNRLLHGTINRLWVRPLERFVVPLSYINRPTRLQRLILKPAAWAANVGRVLLDEWVLDVERWTGPDWSVRYIGNGFSAEALRNILFTSAPTLQHLSQVSLLQVPGLVRSSLQQGDLVVCELNKILNINSAESDFSFTSPQWIKQIVDGIDRPVEEILGAIDQHTRSRVRRLESQGFSYVQAQNQAEFDRFYYQMYMPYIEARHGGKGAIFRGYDYLYDTFRKGALILATQNEELVSGGLCLLKGDLCEAKQMGVLEGSFERVKQGSNVALWWAVLLWAREHGFLRYDLGNSLPLFANGVFQFKRQWGSRVYTDPEVYDQWTFLGRNLPAPLLQHLHSQGFLTIYDGELYRVALVSSGETLDGALLSRALSEAAKCNLAGIVVVTPGAGRRVVRLDGQNSLEHTPIQVL